MKTDIFSLAFLVLLLVYLFGIYTPKMIRFRKMKIVSTDTRGADAALDFLTFIGWQLIPLVFIFSDWLDFANFERPAILGWLGIALLAAAVYIYWRAYRDLADSWSPRIDILKDHQLVSSGIYAHMRHPVYAAMMLWSLANPLLLPNWIAGFALLLTFLPLYLTRMPREEAMMQRTFTDEYDAYMERTGRFWPRKK